MHKVSDLLGREVFSQDAGEKMASVEEVIFDNDTHRVVALLVDGGFLRSLRVVRWGPWRASRTWWPFGETGR
jgi:uncharacterized protein YrrD